MREDSKFSKIILVIIIMGAILSLVYIPKIINKKSTDIDKYYDEIKDYGVNEYIPVMVNDEQMSRKYLNDFKNMLIYDLNGSYELIDYDYRNERFSSIDEYKNFISSLDLSRMTELDKWATYEVNGYKYYDLYDKIGNRFIFKTNGVMQYEVLFDDYYNGGEE